MDQSHSTTTAKADTSQSHGFKMKDEAVKTVGDIAAGSVAIATLVQWLPTIAAGLSVLWLLIRIYEYVLEKFRARRDKREADKRFYS